MLQIAYLRFHVHSWILRRDPVIGFLAVRQRRWSVHAVEHSLLDEQQQASGRHDHGEREHGRQQGRAAAAAVVRGARAHRGTEAQHRGAARAARPTLRVQSRHGRKKLALTLS